MVRFSANDGSTTAKYDASKSISIIFAILSKKWIGCWRSNSFNLFFQQFSQEQAFLKLPINPQPQVPNNQNMNIGNSNNLQELMPSSEQTNKINIAFKADNGLNVIINVDKNVTIFDLFKQYMDKIGLSYKNLGTRIQFFYDGTKVNPFSYAPVYSKFKNNQSILVYDENYVVIG